uniref:Uncharacterized protein LOC114340622 isoform X1 n=1 Tax=Diabrotica virgifera virgifera TaxID=50390 RepID=A0A6P7GCT0_DIAVI
MYISYQILVLISLLTFSTFLVNAKNNILVAAKTIDENGNSKTKIEFNCCNYTKVYTAIIGQPNAANESPKGQKAGTHAEHSTSRVNINITSEVNKPTETLETKSEANDTLLKRKETDTEEKPREMVVNFLRNLISSIENDETKSKCNEEIDDKPNDTVVQEVRNDTVLKETDESKPKGKETVLNSTTKEKPSETVGLILKNVTILKPTADTKSEGQEKPSKIALKTSSILTSKQTGEATLESNDTLLNGQTSKINEQINNTLGLTSNLVSIVVGNATVSSGDLGDSTAPIGVKNLPRKMNHTTVFPSVKINTSMHEIPSDQAPYIPVHVMEQ